MVKWWIVLAVPYPYKSEEVSVQLSMPLPMDPEME
jgi:hypothetical protein